MTPSLLANGGKTGHPPGLLQDDSRKLSNWFASRMNARQEVREVCKQIAQEKNMNDTTEQTTTDELRRAAKLAAPYAVAMIGASHLNEAADTIDTLRAENERLQKEVEELRDCAADACNDVLMQLDAKAAESTDMFTWGLCMKEKYERLRTQLAEAQREAVSLAQTLFKRHYAHEPDYASGKVKWEPCDTPAGIITQIDNMVAGVCVHLAELKAARIAYANEFPLNSDGEPDVGNIHANIRSLKAQLVEAQDALQAAQRLIKEALPKFNWGASFLDANAIQLLNEVPPKVNAAIRAAKE